MQTSALRFIGYLQMLLFNLRQIASQTKATPI